jgi:hypothetical protein
MTFRELIDRVTQERSARFWTVAGGAAAVIGLILTIFVIASGNGTKAATPDAASTKAGSIQPSVITTTSASNPTVSTSTALDPPASPTAVPQPSAGAVLCRPTAKDWPQNDDWQTVGAEYVNRNGNASPVIAPCELSTSNYYVEAQIRPNSAGDVWAMVGVLARVSVNMSVGYRGGVYRHTFCGGCGHAEIDDLLNSQQESVEFGTYADNTIYTIKLVVQGVSQTIYVNNKLVVEQHYTSANDPGRVAVECDRPCEVLSFEVIAL